MSTQVEPGADIYAQKCLGDSMNQAQAGFSLEFGAYSYYSIRFSSAVTFK